MPDCSLDDAVGDVHPFGKKLARPLARLGILCVRDLVTHAPTRYDDLRTMTTVRSLSEGADAVIRGKVITIANRRTRKRSMMMTEALVEDATGTMRCVWFRQPFLVHAFPIGTSVLVAGRVTNGAYGIHLAGPVIERDAGANLHAGRLVPVYPLTYGMTQKQLRFLIHAALGALGTIPDPLEQAILVREKLCPLDQAIRDLHFPSELDDVEVARERLAFDEVLQHCARVRAARAERTRARAVRITDTKAAMEEFESLIPFTLTRAQQSACADIRNDLSGASAPLGPGEGESTVPAMHRLLNGDVGSGKTAVAAAAAVRVVRAGHQVAYLAPTEVLARQHATTFHRWLAPLGISVALWTRTSRVLDGEDVPLRKLREATADGTVGVVIGTHAILSSSVQFQSLAIAMVDEQHRFGVNQRAALCGKAGECVPHFLSMTATPIPRTLHLAFLGDLDVSVLDELPPGRTPTTTHVIGVEERLEMSRAIRAAVAQGRQVFIVCSKIEDTEGDAERAAVDEAFLRAERAFPSARIRALHGRQSVKEKQGTMEAFGRGEVDILVSTTVVEVGVDQPNATIMVVEDAERFGLAQLHQLRGRVGRGDAPGVCYLATRSTNPRSRVRLKRVAGTTDGFALAEFDLAERGPGALVGKVQSGWPELRFATMDAKLIARAQRVADETNIEEHVPAVHLE
jgi:ATP-dependent DNA helicase RecG